MPLLNKKHRQTWRKKDKFLLKGFSCYTTFLKKVHEPLVLLIKVLKPPLYLLWEVQTKINSKIKSVIMCYQAF